MIKDFKPIQYASAYFIRLEELRQLLKEASTLKWNNVKIADEIVAISTSVSCILINSYDS